MATAANSEKQVKVIVIGSNGSGKSSLVDKLRRGENRAPVVNEVAPIEHKGAGKTIQRDRPRSRLGSLVKRKKADKKDKKDEDTAKVL